MRLDLLVARGLGDGGGEVLQRQVDDAVGQVPALAEGAQQGYVALEEFVRALLLVELRKGHVLALASLGVPVAVGDAVDDVEAPLLALPPRPLLAEVLVCRLDLLGERAVDEGEEAGHPPQANLRVEQYRGDEEVSGAPEGLADELDELCHLHVRRLGRQEVLEGLQEDGEGCIDDLEDGLALLLVLELILAGEDPQDKEGAVDALLLVAGDVLHDDLKEAGPLGGIVRVHDTLQALAKLHPDEGRGLDDPLDDVVADSLLVLLRELGCLATHGLPVARDLVLELDGGDLTDRRVELRGERCLQQIHELPGSVLELVKLLLGHLARGGIRAHAPAQDLHHHVRIHLCDELAGKLTDGGDGPIRP
mmetsp:Transcript_33319/g.106316  ORF Transcript_33319/g.106316 Transcript_33319/m.106316 type:complete len:364 (+) Transcript_33319:1727-2818(+)